MATECSVVPVLGGVLLIVVSFCFDGHTVTRNRRHCSTNLRFAVTAEAMTLVFVVTVTVWLVAAAS